MMISVWLTVAKVMALVTVSLLAFGALLLMHTFIGGYSGWILTVFIVWGWVLLVLDIWEWSEG